MFLFMIKMMRNLNRKIIIKLIYFGIPKSKMYKNIQSGYLSARSSSMNTHHESNYNNQIQNSSTIKFPIKDFIKKIHAVSSNPISPNTDRTHDVASYLRNNIQDTQKTNIVSNNALHCLNQNSNVLLPKNMNIINSGSRVSQNSKNFLSDCNNKSQRSYSGLIDSKNYNGNEYISPLTKQSSNKQNWNSENKVDENTIECLARKIQKLTQRMNKNQNQIQMLKFSEVAAIKKLSNQTVNFKQNSKLLSNRKANDQDRELVKQIEQFKKKIKQFQQQLAKLLTKKEFQVKIEGFQWRFKQFNNNKSAVYNLSQQNISQIVQKQVEKQTKLMKEKFNTLITQLTGKSGNGFNKDDDQKNIITLVKMRSNRFAQTAIQFKYSQKIIFNQQENMPNYLSFTKFGHSRCNTAEKSNNNRSPSRIFRQNLAQTQKLQHHLSETTYYIDFEGFLLDADKCYLVDEQNRSIKLGQNQLKILRKLGIMHK